jgi:hypothetical protein
LADFLGPVVLHKEGGGGEEKEKEKEKSYLIYNAYFLTIGGPFHVFYNAFIAIVDHFLIPHALVQHPYDDEPSGVACGKLAVVRVPCRHHH